MYRIFTYLVFYYLLQAIFLRCAEVEKCDVKMWYLDMLTEGVLHGDLNQKQQQIKTDVEKLMRSQKGSIKVQCETLIMYEQILYGLEEEQVTDKQETQEQIKDVTKNEDVQEAQAVENQNAKDSVEGTSENRDTNELKDSDEAQNHKPEPQEQNNLAKMFDDPSDDPTESPSASEADSDDETEWETVLAERTYSEDDSAQDITQEQHDDTDVGDATDIKDLFDSLFGNDELELGNNDQTNSVPNSEEYPQLLVNDSVNDEDLDDTESQEKIGNDGKDENVNDIVREEKQVLQEESTTQEVVKTEGGQVTTEEQVVENKKEEDTKEIEDQTDFEHASTDDSANLDTENNTFEDRHVKKDENCNKESNIETTDSNSLLGIMRKSLAEKSKNYDANGALVCFADNTCSILEPLVINFTQWETVFDDNEKSDYLTNNESGNIDEATPQISRDVIENTEIKQPNVDILESGHITDDSSKVKLDVSVIEDLLNRKKVEYSQKIKDIELQLLKLENRLLSETLLKQNNSASYTKLENLILKLENELLKINSSFVMIKEENNLLKSKQLSEEQIYDIFSKAQEENKEAQEKYLALADNSTALESIVDKQQSKIIDLILMMHNQTDFINKLEERSEKLEEQNRQLHEVLVNQSKMMSELVKGMKYMKEEQDKLKTTVSQPLPTVTRDTSTPDVIENDQSANTDPPNASDNGEVEENKDDVSDETKPNIDKDKIDNHHNGDKLPSDEGILSPDEKLKILREKRKKETATNNENESTPKTPAENVINTEKRDEKPDSQGIYDNNNLKTNHKSLDVDKELKELPSKQTTIEPAHKIVNNDDLNTASKSLDSAKEPKASPSKQTIEPVQEKKSTPKDKVIIPENPRYHDRKSKAPKDCYDHYLAGKKKRDMAMKVKVGSDDLEDREVQVFCDMKNGGWTVIMRRSDGSVDFFRDWDQYKQGFGGVLGEHWIGNDVIHLLTNMDNYRLRVELTDWERNTAWAEYDYFMIDEERNSYKLYVTGFNESSTAGDGLLKHNGMKFSTKDVDNDVLIKDFGGSCANRFSGAWWYYKCYKSNLTGKYYRDGHITEGMFDGISWKSWRPSTISLKKVEMKIIPRERV